MARTATDILKEAILLERRGQAFYSSVAEKTDSPAAKEIFIHMAEEEREHIKFLTDQFQHYDKHKTFISPDNYEEPEEDEVAMRVLSEQMKKEISAASFEAAAISAAIDFEDRAVKIYGERAETAVDPVEKAVYKMLKEWEMGHQKMLHDLNEDLKADIWNDNSFWPF